MSTISSSSTQRPRQTTPAPETAAPRPAAPAEESNRSSAPAADIAQAQEARRSQSVGNTDRAVGAALPLRDTVVQAQAGPRATTDNVQQAFALREASRAKADGDIELGGLSIPRAAPAPTPPGKYGQKALATVFDVALAPLPKGLGFKDWRSADTAKQAMKTPLVQNAEGDPASLGGLTIFRNGLGNLGPSAAQVFRAAQYSDKVVVAFPNMNNPALNTLRPATHVDGVPVPPQLRGKILEIGSSEHQLISYRQSSDIFLNQIEAMRKQPEVLGTDILKAQATVIGHSQGNLDAALTRKRLEAAGLDKVIGQHVAIAPPFRGSSFAEELLGTVAGGISSIVDKDDALRAIRSLDPSEVAKDFGKAEERLVDLSLAGVVGPRPGITPKLDFPPFEIRGNNNVRPILRGMAGGMTLADALDGGDGPSATDLLRYFTHGSYDSDGLVSKNSATYGRQTATLTHPYDHAGIYEDPAVIDEIAKRVGR